MQMQLSKQQIFCNLQLFSILRLLSFSNVSPIVCTDSPGMALLTPFPFYQVVVV